MSKPKFKVGDKIIGTKKANTYAITRDGWIGTVIEIVDDSFIGDIKVKGESSIYGIDVFTVDSDDFELYKPEKIIIYRNGSQVIAKNTATGKTGVAKCNPADEFDFNTGAKLAFERLTNPEPEKPKYYSGKVVCTKSSFDDFKVGKVYEFIDGQTTDECGIHRPIGYRLTSLKDDKCFMITYNFIPLIED